MGFSELLSLCRAPSEVVAFHNTKTGVQFLHDEYATLSRAVHASAVDFRMTESAAAVCFGTLTRRAPESGHREKLRSSKAFAWFLRLYFSEKLTGTQLSNLRSMLNFAVSASKKTILKKD